MLETLRLLLPIFAPSWVFFNEVAPSPRIEYSLQRTLQDEDAEWQEMLLRPESMSVWATLLSMFYNPSWNEALYMMNCAERLIINPTAHSEQEIINRIQAKLMRDKVDLHARPYLRFRLVFVSREGTGLRRDILYISEFAEMTSNES